MIRLSCVTLNKRKCPYARAEKEGMGGGGGDKSHPHPSLYPSSGMREPSQAIEEVFTTVRKTIDDPYRTLYLSLYRVDSCFRCGVQRSITIFAFAQEDTFGGYNKIHLLQRCQAFMSVSYDHF